MDGVKPAAASSPAAVAGEFTAGSIGLVCALALTQYAVNSALAATREALRDSKSVGRTWRESYLWISTTTVASGPNAILFGLGSPAGIFDATPARALSGCSARSPPRPPPRPAAARLQSE